MPQQRISMRKILAVLRCYYGESYSKRKTAQYLGLSPATVRNYISRAKQAGLVWPLPEGMTEEVLEALLFPSDDSSPCRPQPDWKDVHRQLSRKGMTLERVWSKYRATHPDGYSYGHFCELYREWLGPKKATLRIHHAAGEKLFVDFAGTTVDVTDPSTGEVYSAQIFVATLGCSKYTYVEAVMNQKLRSWIGAHVRALEFLGGVPKVIVCDNLKAAVVRPDRYNPDLNPTYREFGEHYDCHILAARPYRPQDKSVVEGAVKFVTNRILSELRTLQFFSLSDLNQMIASMLKELNDLPFQKQLGSRRSQFEEHDFPALTPLPANRFDYREWKKYKVSFDYHIQVEYNYYSVPSRYIGKYVHVCIRENVIECYVKDQRVATHARLRLKGRFSTEASHMPEKHRRYMDQQYWIARARDLGPNVMAFVELVMARRSFIEQNYRSIMGILGLQDKYSRERLDAACHRAILIGERAHNYPSIARILKHMKEHEEGELSPPPVIDHKNIRGGAYYKNKSSR